MKDFKSEFHETEAPVVRKWDIRAVSQTWGRA